MKIKYMLYRRRVYRNQKAPIKGSLEYIATYDKYRGLLAYVRKKRTNTKYSMKQNKHHYEYISKKVEVK